MTTVTITNDLRRKLKYLAAKYDTNQAEIIRKSVEVFEMLEKGGINLEQFDGLNISKEKMNDNNLAQFKNELDEAKQNFERNYPEIAQFYKSLRTDSNLLEEITIKNWDLPFEEE